MSSVWRKNSSFPSFKSLSRDIETDVLVIGGGLCGVLCAHYLTKMGVNCVLLEANEICGGVTNYTTAKITAQHGAVYSRLIKYFGQDRARLYYNAHTDATEEYGELCRDIDCDFRRTPSYLYSTGNPSELEAEFSALKMLGIPVSRKESEELPFKTSYSLRFDNQAVFNPLKLTARLVGGLEIYERSRVLGIVGTTAYTSDHSVRAKRIIVATHFPFINSHGFYYLKMYQERSYVLALTGAPKLSGMYLGIGESGISLRSAGDVLLVGGGAHRTGKGGCGWHICEEFKKKFYPDAEVYTRFATQDCMSLDAMAYIGKYSALSDGLYVATGFNKWGMTSSMVAARLLSDLIIGKSNVYAELFTPSRSILRRGLLTNTKEAISGWLSFGKPRCSHLGCALNYNRYENSWDCSCHGSRFNEDGELLDNPANTDL